MQSKATCFNGKIVGTHCFGQKQLVMCQTIFLFHRMAHLNEGEFKEGQAMV